ncbi:hypothetical protein CM49_00415 [Paenibacillus sp. P1XP2]|nr:hypothetical protein CM49_00415 [Paenibacillus sp. P1XP2]
MPGFHLLEKGAELLDLAFQLLHLQLQVGKPVGYVMDLGGGIPFGKRLANLFQSIFLLFQFINTFETEQGFMAVQTIIFKSALFGGDQPQLGIVVDRTLADAPGLSQFTDPVKFHIPI